MNLWLDRDKASALGVSANQIEDALNTSYGSREISTIYAPNNDYSVIMEFEPRFQDDPALMSQLYVRASSGKLVPLDVLVKRSLGVGPLSVAHSGQMPSVTLTFNLRPGVSLGQAVDTVEAAARNLLPASFSTKFEGTAQAFQSSFAGLWVLLVLCIVVIYIVLGILYESFIHPLTILSGLPSAGVGALATLLLFRMDLDIYGFVGIIMLVGIVKKNAIMMIDFALEAQRDLNLTPAEAILKGCLIRFRPIMMTTMSALMGTLPIALGFGAGAEARRPLGLAVVGGLMVSQLLTLFFTPVYYIYLDRFQTWASRRFSRKSALAGTRAGRGRLIRPSGRRHDRFGHPRPRPGSPRGRLRRGRPGPGPPLVLRSGRTPPGLRPLDRRLHRPQARPLPRRAQGRPALPGRVHPQDDDALPGGTRRIRQAGLLPPPGRGTLPAAHRRATWPAPATTPASPSGKPGGAASAKGFPGTGPRPARTPPRPSERALAIAVRYSADPARVRRPRGPTPRSPRPTTWWSP